MGKRNFNEFMLELAVFFPNRTAEIISMKALASDVISVEEKPSTFQYEKVLAFFAAYALMERRVDSSVDQSKFQNEIESLNWKHPEKESQGTETTFSTYEKKNDISDDLKLLMKRRLVSSRALFEKKPLQSKHLQYGNEKKKKTQSKINSKDLVPKMYRRLSGGSTRFVYTVPNEEDEKHEKDSESSSNDLGKPVLKKMISSRRNSMERISSRRSSLDMSSRALRKSSVDSVGSSHSTKSKLLCSKTNFISERSLYRRGSLAQTRTMDSCRTSISLDPVQTQLYHRPKGRGRRSSMMLNADINSNPKPPTQNPGDVTESTNTSVETNKTSSKLRRKVSKLKAELASTKKSHEKIYSENRDLEHQLVLLKTQLAHLQAAEDERLFVTQLRNANNIIASRESCLADQKSEEKNEAPQQMKVSQEESSDIEYHIRSDSEGPSWLKRFTVKKSTESEETKLTLDDWISSNTAETKDTEPVEEDDDPNATENGAQLWNWGGSAEYGADSNNDDINKTSEKDPAERPGLLNRRASLAAGQPEKRSSLSIFQSFRRRMSVS